MAEARGSLPSGPVAHAPAIPAALVRGALGAPDVEPAVEEFAGVSIDSRTLEPGNLFVALRGERYDGNDFIAAAVEAGAAAVIAERPPAIGHSPGIGWWRCSDGGTALRRLALAHREAMRARVVCVTGSNGKTGTKELIAAVLGRSFRVVRTSGNRNNQIGLPLSLLELRSEHEWGVFEIGTSQPGEIARLAALARPEIGVITNVAPSHLDGLLSLEGVVSEKTDLAAALGREGTLVYGGDGAVLGAAVEAFSCARVSFGLHPANDVHPERWELDPQGRPVFTVNAPGQPGAADARIGEIRLQLVGVANLLNALAAVAVGKLAGVPPVEIRRGLESLEPLPLRLEVLSARGVTVIQDCYNANPDSMRRGVETLRSIAREGARVAVLGGMRELGDDAERLHYALGRELAHEPLDLLLVYGEDAVALARGYQSGTDAPTYFFKDYLALVRFLNERVAAPATVLFKASRGVALDRAAMEYLVELRAEEGRG